MNGVDRIRSKVSTAIHGEHSITLSIAKLMEWIAAEAVFTIFVGRFAVGGASCEHRCCGVHPIGARSFDGCVECFCERENFSLAYFDDPPLYIAAIEAALLLSAPAPAI